jgi:hypothetical protein
MFRPMRSSSGVIIFGEETAVFLVITTLVETCSDGLLNFEANKFCRT